MKKLYLTIIIIITVFCVLIGLTIHGLAFLIRTGKKIENPVVNRIQASDASSVSEDYEVSAFSSLKLDVGLSNITIQEGSSYGLTYSGAKDLAPVLDTDSDGKLKITQKSKDFKALVKNAESLSDDNRMTITIPEGTALKSLSGEIGMGNVVIEGIDADEIKLDLEMGSFDLNGGTFSELSIDADMGSVNINDVTAKEVKLDANMGGIKALNISGFKKMKLDANMGSITVNTDMSLSDMDLDLSASLGDISVNGDKVGSKAKLGNGSVSVKASANCGSIDINTK